MLSCCFSDVNFNFRIKSDFAFRFGKKDQNTTAANIALLHQKLITYNLITDRVRNISGIISQRERLHNSVKPNSRKSYRQVYAMDGLQIDTGKITFSVSSLLLYQ